MGQRISQIDQQHKASVHVEVLGKYGPSSHDGSDRGEEDRRAGTCCGSLDKAPETRRRDQLSLRYVDAWNNDFQPDDNTFLFHAACAKEATLFLLIR